MIASTFQRNALIACIWKEKKILVYWINVTSNKEKTAMSSEVCQKDKVYIGIQDSVDAFRTLIHCNALIRQKRYVYTTDSALKGFNTSASFKIRILPGSPLDLLFKRSIQRARKRKKIAIWAVTHGYEVKIPAKDSDGKDYIICLRKPSQVNSVVRLAKFIPPFKIYDKSGNLFKLNSKIRWKIKE